MLQCFSHVGWYRLIAELQHDAFFVELPVQLRGEIAAELTANVLKDGHVFCDLVSLVASDNIAAFCMLSFEIHKERCRMLCARAISAGHTTVSKHGLRHSLDGEGLLEIFQGIMKAWQAKEAELAGLCHKTVVRICCPGGTAFSTTQSSSFSLAVDFSSISLCSLEAHQSQPQLS